MQSIDMGEREMRVAIKLMTAAESGLPTPRLNATEREALRTLLRRLTLFKN